MRVGHRTITREDVWSLLAVAYVGWDGRGAESRSIARLCRILRRVRAGGDRGLRRSLDRLCAAGLVAKAGGLYHASPRVTSFLRVRVHRRGIWHDYRDLLHHLGID